MRNCEYYSNYVMYRLGTLGVCFANAEEIEIANKRVQRLVSQILYNYRMRGYSNDEMNKLIIQSIDDNLKDIAKAIDYDINEAKAANSELSDEQKGMLITSLLSDINFCTLKMLGYTEYSFSNDCENITHSQVQTKSGDYRPLTYKDIEDTLGPDVVDKLGKAIKVLGELDAAVKHKANADNTNKTKSEESNSTKTEHSCGCKGTCKGKREEHHKMPTDDLENEIRRLRELRKNNANKVISVINEAYPEITDFFNGLFGLK